MVAPRSVTLRSVLMSHYCCCCVFTLQITDLYFISYVKYSELCFDHCEMRMSLTQGGTSVLEPRK